MVGEERVLALAFLAAEGVWLWVVLELVGERVALLLVARRVVLLLVAGRVVLLLVAGRVVLLLTAWGWRCC